MQPEKITERSGKERNSETASGTASPASPTASKIIPLPGSETGEGEADKKATKYLRDWFDFKGRTYRIQKRSAERQAAWYLVFEHNKERFNQSLHTSEKKTAIENAKIKIEAILAGKRDVLRQTLHGGGKPNYCTIGDVITWFENHSDGVEEDTARSYVNTLKHVLRQVYPAPADVLALSAEVLSKAFVRAYFEKFTTAARAGASQSAGNTIKRTANSTLNQAKALFCERRIEDMKEDGLLLPDLKPFLLACKTRKFEGVNKKDHRMPSDEIIAATLESWRQLEDRNVFIAVGLALSCGLRMSEIAQACGSWVTTRDGAPYLSGQANVKGGYGELSVRPIDPYWRELWARVDEKQWHVKPEETLLQGTFSELDNRAERRISLWMQGLGWTTQKKAHALRAYSGGLVALRYGLYAAQAFLRHTSYKTTETHYSYLVKPESRTMAPEKVGIQWAVNEKLTNRPSK